MLERGIDIANLCDSGSCNWFCDVFILSTANVAVWQNKGDKVMLLEQNIIIIIAGALVYLLMGLSFYQQMKSDFFLCLVAYPFLLLLLGLSFFVERIEKEAQADVIVEKKRKRMIEKWKKMANGDRYVITSEETEGDLQC